MSRSWLLGAGSVAFVVLAGACGGGSHPETGGVAPREYFALFSGQWTLDREASDDPRARTPRRDGPGGFMEPDRGGRRAPPSGGLPGRRAGRRGGRVNVQAMRATMAMARSRPPSLELNVSESSVTVLWPGTGDLEVPVAGDPVAVSRDGVEVRVRARWDGPRLILERRVVEGGAVVDALEPVASGGRLLVTRTLEGLPRTPPELRLAYDRVESDRE